MNGTPYAFNTIFKEEVNKRHNIPKTHFDEVEEGVAVDLGEVMVEGPELVVVGGGVLAGAAAEGVVFAAVLDGEGEGAGADDGERDGPIPEPLLDRVADRHRERRHRRRLHLEDLPVAAHQRHQPLLLRRRRPIRCPRSSH